MGDLSAAEARYRDIVVAGTGLDPGVVAAWIACESGWGVTKPDSNYLNIGPGRAYPSVDAAAGDAVNLISSSGNYTGIRAAASAHNAAAQIDAIIASPWDAGHYSNGCLKGAWSGLGGGSGGVASAVALTSSAGGGSALGDIVGGLGGLLFGDTSSVYAAVILVGITIVFVLSGFGLIALGLNRMTGGKLAETAQQAGKTAAVAAAA